ncbi:MAG: hypothetical protein HQL04_07740 [Nitrospirae bacterium]|nr:hypothetical protein [Nitrospirota bacterium]
MLRHILSFIGIVAIGCLFYLLFDVELKYIVSKLVTIPLGTDLLSADLETWEGYFMKGALIVCITATSFSLVWYVVAQWGMKVVDWKSAGKRTWWTVLFLILFVATLAFGIYYLKDSVEMGLVWAVGLYVLNGALCYYLSTLLLSPVAFKYTPLGAMTVRRYW